MFDSPQLHSRRGLRYAGNSGTLGGRGFCVSAASDGCDGRRRRRKVIAKRLPVCYTVGAEVIRMTDKEQAAMLIDVYMDLLRIKQSPNRDDEIENQLCAARAKLQALGIVVDDLVIK